MCKTAPAIEIIEKYKSIKDNFIKQCSALNIPFDEDIYSDAMLKCFEKLAPRGVRDIDEAKNYLWCAFKTNTYREYKYSRNRRRVGMTDDIDPIDEEYDTSIDEAYEKITKDIEDTYGAEWLSIVKRHIEDGATYDELSKEYGMPKNLMHSKCKKNKKLSEGKIQGLMGMIIAITLGTIALVLSIVAIIFRRSEPDGQREEKEWDGLLCDDLTLERIVELLQDCKELNLENTIIIVKDIKKQKKGGK